MIIDLAGCQPEWVKFPENAKPEDQLELLIAPYPQSMANTRVVLDKDSNTKGQMIFTGEDQLKAFKECFKDYRVLPGGKGLTDAEGKPVKLTDEFKTALFNFEWKLKTGIREFVLRKSGALSLAREEGGKN